MAFNTAANSVSNNGGTDVSGAFAAEGPTTIVWGTCNQYAGYIVVSASQTARVEEIDIEQCAGFEAIVILLNKGFDVELTVIDDTATTPPAIGATVSLLSAYGDSVPMLVVGMKSDQSRKREGMRVITAKSFNAVTGLH
jgi:hypothetical protein